MLKEQNKALLNDHFWGQMMKLRHFCTVTFFHLKS